MDINHQAKAKRWFVALAEMGPELPEEYGKHLRDGVWELRVIIQHHQHRSAKVPPAEIEKSRKAMADWISRRGWEDL